MMVGGQRSCSYLRRFPPRKPMAHRHTVSRRYSTKRHSKHCLLSQLSHIHGYFVCAVGNPSCSGPLFGPEGRLRANVVITYTHTYTHTHTHTYTHTHTHTKTAVMSIVTEVADEDTMAAAAAAVLTRIVSTARGTERSGVHWKPMGAAAKRASPRVNIAQGQTNKADRQRWKCRRLPSSRKCLWLGGL